MWQLVVQILMHLLRWCLVHFVAKPVFEWIMIRLLSRFLLEGFASDGAGLEDVVDVDIEDVAGAIADMEETV